MSNSTVFLSGEDKSFTFVMIPKLWDSPFYEAVWESFCAPAVKHDVNCIRFPSDVYADAEKQADLLYNIVKSPANFGIKKVDGVAIAVIDEIVTGKAIDFVRSQNISVITYDSDAPKSARLAFISTNSTVFGEELGKVLNQLYPIGGGYAMITGLGSNMQDRVEGVRRRLAGTTWVEVLPPLNCNEEIPLSLAIMSRLGADPIVKAVISVGGWPLWNSDPASFRNFSRENGTNSRYKTTTVIADTSPIAVSLMSEGYVDGLVGQLPHDIGSLCFEVLMNITEGRQPSSNSYGTHYLEVLRIPQLAPVKINYNHIGGLAALGYTFFAIAALLSTAFMYWTYVNKNTRTVRASQPVFMAMLCGGSLIMASAMIPLGITDQSFSQKGTDAACMSIPWLISIGFCTIFSALFTKTWRIVRIVENAARFQRVAITVEQVLYPYLSLLTMNVTILICWTTINPLVYERTNDLGTDGWNRVISSHGHCVSSNRDTAGTFTPYLGSIAILNGGLLVLANAIAYRARSISTEFGESKYIAIVMFSMLQAFMIGGPLIFFVLQDPLAYYVVIVLLDFAVCMATLLFMFIPKLLAHRHWLKKQKLKNKTTSPEELGDDPCTATNGSFRGIRRLRRSFRQGMLRRQEFNSNLYSNPTTNIVEKKDGESGLKFQANESVQVDRPQLRPCFQSKIILTESDVNGSTLSYSSRADEIVRLFEGLPEEDRIKLHSKLYSKVRVQVLAQPEVEPAAQPAGTAESQTCCDVK